MNRRRYIWIALAVVVFVIVTGLVLQQRARGPRYEGRTVEQWLATLKYGEDVRTNAAIHAALTTLGSNAIPPLMKILDRDDSLLDKLAQRALHARSVPNRVKAAASRRQSRRHWQPYHAACAMPFTGTNSLNALPGLERIICDTNRPSGDGIAMYALARIGRPAIPTLARLFTNAPPARQQSLKTVVLMEWSMQLQARDLEAREQAALALSELFPTCYQNIPALKSMCESRDPVKREAALGALSKLVPEFVAARDVVRKAAESDDPHTRRIAAGILQTNGIPRILKPVE